MILMYVQNLHEHTDAKGISLYANKYDFLQDEDYTSLIDQWTLKPKKNKVVQSQAKSLSPLQDTNLTRTV